MHPSPLISIDWKRSRLTGMTLMELLLVLVVVAVLAALLFPLLGVVAERGRNVGCIANLKTIGVAVHQYAAENNGALPIPYSSQYPYSGSTKGLNEDTRMKGFYHLLPYIAPGGDKYDLVKVMHCPSSAMTLDERRMRWGGTVLWGAYSQYCGWGPRGGNSALLPNSSDRINEEGRSKLLFLDNTLREGSSNENVSNHRTASGAPRGANALYIGGHVKWIPTLELTFSITRAGGTYLFPSPYTP